jgi:hypothetical protein
MTTFNPRDWWDPSGLVGRPGRRPEERNREAFQRWAMSLAFCLCFASLAPSGVFPLALTGFLVVSALASMGLAGLMRADPLAPHFTPWDEAAWSLTLGLALHLAA